MAPAPPSVGSSSNLNPNQYAGAFPPKMQTKLTWKFIPEPTAAQIAAAKSSEGVANNGAA